MRTGLEARWVGSAALAALRGRPARVFAAFERSCYVETPLGIACLGNPGLGLGPLNAIVENFEAPATGDVVSIDLSSALLWQPSVSAVVKEFPGIEIPKAIKREASAFLSWLKNEGTPLDTLIGLGPGLTPAGDDFVGGAMIALRVCGTTAGHAALADRIAAWALPLARTNTNRISRAHLECAAAGEGHEALHDLLCSFEKKHLERLARIGHTSGLDAAAGALLALKWCAAPATV
jgi:hypothetical protein